MTGVIRKITGAPNRKEVAKTLNPLTSPVKPIAPEPELAAPKLGDQRVQDAVRKELKKNSRQRGRASTTLRGVVGDDSTLQPSSAKQTLGA